MKIRTSLLALLAAGALAACSAEKTEATTPATTGAGASTEVVIPSQADADAAAAGAITEENADTAFADLEKEINADM